MKRTIESKFYCTCCGKANFPIRRKLGKEREAGHLKKLFCLNCKEEKNCVEIKEFATKYTYQDFLYEFNNGNFTKDGNRTMSYKEFLRGRDTNE